MTADSPTSRWSRALGRAAALALLALVVPACEPEARPSMDEWSIVWNQALELVPEPQDLEGEDVHQHCHELLVGARELQGSLVPSPSPTLDGPMREWLEKAELIGFECRAQHGHPDQTRQRLEELAVLRAEIEAGVEARRDQAG